MPASIDKTRLEASNGVSLIPAWIVILKCGGFFNVAVFRLTYRIDYFAIILFLFKIVTGITMYRCINA
jgi:hypothetical protein